MNQDLHVIDDEKKIINIFDLLAKTNAILNLRNLLTEYNGRITEIKHNQFVFSPNLKILDLQKKLHFSFFYLNKYHYFTTEMIDADKKNLIIKMPKQIYIHYRRKDKRYKIEKDDIKCNLKIINVSGEERETRKIKKIFNNIEFVYKELDQDKPDFTKIVKLIAENNKNFCNDFKIIIPIFNLQNKAVIPFLSIYKKPFLVNNTLNKDAYLDEERQENLVTMKDFISYLSRQGNKNISDEVNKLIDFYKKEEIYSILYIPVVVLGEVFGVLRIANTFSRKIRIDINDVSYFQSIGSIFNELIIKNKLNSLKDDSLKIEVDDISVSGIGMLIDDNAFSSYLKQNTRLKVFLEYHNKPWLNFIGSVKRITSKDDKKHVGIIIDEVLPDNKTKLVNYINSHFLNPEDFT